MRVRGPGDTHSLGHGLWVRAFRTHHPVPSLGYQFFRRVSKLKPEHQHLPPEEIARGRKAGVDLFDEVERLELAYATARQTFAAAHVNHLAADFQLLALARRHGHEDALCDAAQLSQCCTE